MTFWLSGYFAARLRAGKLAVFTKGHLLTGAIGAAVMTLFFFGVGLARMASTDLGLLNLVLVKLSTAAFGHMTVFSGWLTEYWSRPFNPSLGTTTFAGPLEKLGYGVRIPGIFPSVVDLVAGETSNVYTGFRPLIEDFTIPGALVVMSLLGFIGGAGYRNVTRRKVERLSPAIDCVRYHCVEPDYVALAIQQPDGYCVHHRTFGLVHQTLARQRSNRSRVGDHLATQSKEIYVEEGVDALAILTPLIERRRQIILGVLLISLAVGIWASVKPRKYKAEMALTPVVNNRSTQALGGLAALAGATLQTGYQLTPGRMVELLKSRAVLAGVGFSQVGNSPRQRVIDRVMDEPYDLNDAEDVAKRIIKLMDVEASKETGTITLSVAYKDSALARIIASRVVDSASVLFVRTSRAQAQQLRIAQEARVENAAAGLASAEERLRQFNDENRATPPFSAAGLEKDRLNRDAVDTDRDPLYEHETG